MKFGKTYLNKLNLPIVAGSVTSNSLDITQNCIVVFSTGFGQSITTIPAVGDFVIIRIENSSIYLNVGSNIKNLNNGNITLTGPDCIAYSYNDTEGMWYQLGRATGTDLNGAQGDLGAGGDAGETGISGTQGAQGNDGSSGEEPYGPPGEIGPTGSQGAQG